MTRISVIVPVFNVRDYLETCVKSIQAQTVADWELILVDDGSADGSGELCDRLAEADGRIRVLHRTNAGVGAARNAGLDAAKGEYILFLDGDDSYEPVAMERLLSLIEDTGADAAAAGALWVNEKGEITKHIAPQNGVYASTEDILRAFFLHSAGLDSCWGKLFRTSVLKDIRFSAYTRAEDALFCARALTRCGVYSVSKETLYRYLRRSDSVTMSAVRTASADQVRAWEEICALLERTAP